METEAAASGVAVPAKYKSQAMVWTSIDVMLDMIEPAGVLLKGFGEWGHNLSISLLYWLMAMYGNTFPVARSLGNYTRIQAE